MIGKAIFLLVGIASLVGAISSEDPFWNIVGMLAFFFCLLVASADTDEEAGS